MAEDLKSKTIEQLLDMLSITQSGLAIVEKEAERATEKGKVRAIVEEIINRFNKLELFQKNALDKIIALYDMIHDLA